MNRAECIDLSARAFNAVIFDLDGVVTDTASLHARAWKKMFDAYLEEKNKSALTPYAPFDDRADYLNYVDGKPRIDGAADFLRSRGIGIPYGRPQDTPDQETAGGLGNRKNEIFQALLSKGEVKVYETSVALIRRLRREGIRTAIISSSKNCRKILESVHITHLFDQRVDGIDSEQLGLAGKPAPDIFLRAAKQLAVDPKQAVVVEDAQAGVKAGKRGGFGFVIGVDRIGQAEALRRNGADVVVKDMADVSVEGEPILGEGGIPSLPNALAHVDDILHELDNRTPLVFLDYDGTLTPIVRRPEDADLSEEMRRIIMDLAHEVPVAIVSGRDLQDVKRRVKIDRLYYAGSHGFDIAGPGDRRVSHQAGSEFLEALDKAEILLEQRSMTIPGCQVERKKFSIAVHYRNVSLEEVPRVAQAVAQTLKEVPELKEASGKKVFDIRPNIDWDKGKAVRWLMEKAMAMDLPKSLPIYIGDDLTDEDAFRELMADGVGIRVEGNDLRKSDARYRLESTDEVQQFLKALFEAVHQQRTHRNWRLVYEGFDPPRERLREALCTLGNGYFCTRGAAPESVADDTHYPGTYFAGGYNRLKTEVAGRIIENEDLVNMPNWLPLTFRIDNGPWFSHADVQLLEYRQELDIRHGTLCRRIRFKDSQERVTRLFEQRLVSMQHVHMAALETTITPENWSGVIEFKTSIDGRVVNNGVTRYRSLNHEHLTPLDADAMEGETLFLKVETNQSKLQVALAARTRAFKKGSRLLPERRTLAQNGYVASLFKVAAEPGAPIRIEKIVALYTSRDPAISECGREALNAVRRAETFDSLLSAHRQTWYHLWQRFEINLETVPSVEEVREVGMIVHLYIFHVLQTTSTNTMSMALDVGAPARGWHGEAYRGHVFWDELFIFPMINLRLPEITKSLLMYRYRRLEAARRAARKAGFKGAMFPWQSGSNGREESQELHLNPRSGRWIPDRSHRQRHVNAAIAYNLYHYYQATRDMEFLRFYGAEMMLEIARFWASIATYNPRLDRFEILGVMGPDEYHDGYPGAEIGGLNNNAYTNIMAVWVLKRSRELMDLLPADVREEFRDKMNLTDEELEFWAEISRKMRLVFHEEGIVSQFEGYDQLEEFQWEKYRAKYGDIQRLDRIMEAEGDSTNRYKASKQADVLMLFYLLSAEELGEIISGLGYPFHYDTIPKNIDYYLARTSHGSTLSRVVHSWVLARKDRPGSWRLFFDALNSDVTDIQGGTTPEGIHMGAMAGVVDQLQRGYTGIVTREEVLWFSPCLPRELDRLRFRILYRHQLLEIDLTSEFLSVSGPSSLGRPIRIGFEEKIHELSPGETLYFQLPPEKRTPMNA